MAVIPVLASDACFVLKEPFEPKRLNVALALPFESHPTS
jgi:hypothetical protein